MRRAIRILLAGLGLLVAVVPALGVTPWTSLTKRQLVFSADRGSVADSFWVKPLRGDYVFTDAVGVPRQAVYVPGCTAALRPTSLTILATGQPQAVTFGAQTKTDSLVIYASASVTVGINLHYEIPKTLRGLRWRTKWMLASNARIRFYNMAYFPTDSSTHYVDAVYVGGTRYSWKLVGAGYGTWSAYEIGGSGPDSAIVEYQDWTVVGTYAPNLSVRSAALSDTVAVKWLSASRRMLSDTLVAKTVGKRIQTLTSSIRVDSLYGYSGTQVVFGDGKILVGKANKAGQVQIADGLTHWAGWKPSSGMSLNEINSMARRLIVEFTDTTPPYLQSWPMAGALATWGVRATPNKAGVLVKWTAYALPGSLVIETDGPLTAVPFTLEAWEP